MVAGMFLARRCCLRPAVGEVHTVPLDLLSHGESIALNSQEGKAVDQDVIKQVPEAVKFPSTSSQDVTPLASTAPRCRICWDDGDEEPGGRLISPCKCTGSVSSVHVRCLEKWQITLRSQGYHRKAKRCDICCGRYHLLQSHHLPLSKFGVWENKKIQRILVEISRAANFVFEAWQLAVLGAGTAGAVRGGLCRGKKGMGISWGHCTAVAGWVGKWVPEMCLSGAVAPRLRRPLVAGVCLIGAASALEIVVVAGSCATVGAVAGFACGSSRVALWPALKARAWCRRGLQGVFRGLRRAVGAIMSPSGPFQSLAVAGAAAAGALR